MKSSDYKQAERILYDYLYTSVKAATIAHRLKVLNLDLRAQNYSSEARLTGGIPSDPVGSLYQEREMLQINLEYYRAQVQAVKSFLELILSKSEQDARIITFSYFRKMKVEEVARDLCMSVRNIYARKNLLVKKFAKYCRNRDII